MLNMQQHATSTYDIRTPPSVPVSSKKNHDNACS